MLRSLLLLLGTLALARVLPAQSWHFDDSPGPAWSLEVLAEDAGGVLLEFRLRRLETQPGAEGLQLRLEGAAGAGSSGQPDLPLISSLLAVPPRAGLALELLEAEHQWRPGAPPAALPADHSDLADAQPERDWSPDGSIYGGGTLWPEEAHRLDAPVIWRGQRLAPLVIQPVAWNPATGEYRITVQLRLRLRYDGEDRRNLARADRRPSAAALAQVGAAVLNPAALSADPERVGGATSLGRYLVICPDAALPALQPWAQWRRQQGWELRVLPLSEVGPAPTFEQLRAVVQAEYDGPGLDCLLLVGDLDRYPSAGELDFNLAGGFIQGSSYAEPGWGGRCGGPSCIVSDHLYALLDGDDDFGDILVGRLPVDNLNQAWTVFNKLLSYDREPYLGQGEDWFQRALMVYDVGLGMSRRETKLAIRDMLLEHAGFGQVDTIRNHYWNNPVSPLLVKQRVENGLSLVNYRGYGYRFQWYGPQFHVNDALALQNVGRWPLVTSIVCGGGDFAGIDTDPCFGEAWMRAGNPAAPSGAIGFMAPSELDTYIRYNNALDLGIYQGLIVEGRRRMGELLDRGKLEVWQVLPNDRNWGTPGRNVPFYFHCYNLLGDPGLELRAAAPREIAAELPEWLPAGELALELQLSDGDGEPLAGALACLLDATAERRVLAVAGEDGRVVLEGAALAPGEWTLTLHGRDLLPRQQTVAVGTAVTRLELLAVELAGDEDGLASPGESLELRPLLVEDGAEGWPETRLLGLESEDERLQILTASILLPPTQPGDTLEPEEGLPVQLSSWLADGESLAYWWTLDGERLVRRRLQVSAFACAVAEIGVLDGGLEPGGEAVIQLRLEGTGSFGAGSLRAELHSLIGGLSIDGTPSAAFDLEPGAETWVGPFSLAAGAELLPGTPAGCLLIVRQDGQPDAPPLALAPFSLELGQSLPQDPYGPDLGGYLCFHSQDLGWDQAPMHEWESIAGQGTPLGLVDTPDDPWFDSIDGKSALVELPFEFSFYGQDYDQITVCTNGWAAFGDHRNHWTAINTPIPAAQGPPAMVAVYWTNLINSNGGAPFGQLYTWHDSAEQRFVIEWNNFRPDGVPNTLNAQLILLDPNHWPTATGDGALRMVYGATPSYAGINGFTAGLENQDETGGLQLAFNGQFAQEQAVTAGVTLHFTPMEPLSSLAPAPARPHWFKLEAAAPNPFNPVTRLAWRLEQPARLDWTLVNLLGQRVLTGGRDAAAGEGWIPIDGSALGSGLYLLEVRAAAGGETQALRQKLLLAK
jgi:hypothetical protein